MSDQATGDLAPSVRPATARDLPAAAELLDAFNREFDEPTPGPEVLEARLHLLLATGDAVLLAGDGPDAIAILRLRPALWSEALEAYLAELYVVPGRRGRGLGRSLLEAALKLARARGADHIDLGTSEDDVAARALYERLSFTCRDAGGAQMYVYERSL